MHSPHVDSDQDRRQRVVRLAVLFGVLYFIQGIGEPATGLMKQPVLKLLKDWNTTPEAIGVFGFWIGLPWWLKPLYGLLTDFLPISGSRRRNWLIASAALTVTGFGLLVLIPSWQTRYSTLLACLMLANFGVAFSDVVIDGLMIERGQPLQATGRFQSIQWACMMTAGALAGISGGWISQHGHQALGFVICFAATALTILLGLAFVSEPNVEIPRQNLRSMLRAVGRTLRSRTILACTAFLFLWNFNPFSDEVLNQYMTEVRGFDEQFVGTLSTVQSFTMIVASLAYAVYCTRVRFSWLIHGSILLGVISTAAYWALEGRTSALLITVAIGFTYQTATMIQLDLAARVCPPQVAGTIFALLMSVSNFGTDSARWLGGALYGDWTAQSGATDAFRMLVVTGAAFTAGCWLLAPLLVHGVPHAEPSTPPVEG